MSDTSEKGVSSPSSQSHNVASRSHGRSVSGSFPPRPGLNQQPPPLPPRPHAEGGSDFATTSTLTKRFSSGASALKIPDEQPQEEPTKNGTPSLSNDSSFGTFSMIATNASLGGINSARPLAQRKKPLPIPVSTLNRSSSISANQPPKLENQDTPTTPPTSGSISTIKLPPKPLPSIPTTTTTSTVNSSDDGALSPTDEPSTEASSGTSSPKTTNDAEAMIDTSNMLTMEEVQRRLSQKPTRTEEHPGYAINDTRNKAYEETYRVVDRLEPRMRRESIMVKTTEARKRLVKPLPEIPGASGRRRRSSQSRRGRKPLPVPNAALRRDSLHHNVPSDAGSSSNTSSPRIESPEGESIPSTDDLRANSPTITANGTDGADDESSETTSESVSESVAESRAESITAFHQACFSGEVELIRQMLQRCSDGDGSRAQDGVADSDDETEDELCGMSRYELVNSRDPIDNSTGLHKAAARGQCAAMEILIENGALIDAIDSVEGAPIHYAASNNRADAISVLAKYAPVRIALISLRDGYGYLPFHLCIKAGHFEAAEVLLIFGADPNSRTRGGKTALSIVCENNDARGLQFLITKGAQINAKDDQGMSALLRVISTNQTNLLRCILNNFSGQNGKALNFLFTNKDTGWNAMHYAVIHSNQDTLPLLVERIFDSNACERSLAASLLKQRDNINQSTPLHLAVAINEKPTAVRAIIEAITSFNQEILAELLAIQDTFGNTPLHTAIMQNKWVCCEIFVSCLGGGASFNNILKIKNSNKQTPASLFKAAGRDWKKFLV